MRIGLIGAGRRGQRWAAAVQTVLLDLPAARWAGVADARLEAAQQLAEHLHTRAYASTLDVLDEADLVVVAVPVRDRALVASEALRRGAHVLALWPPAASAVEVEALGRLAEEAGREVAVAHALPVAPLLRTIGLGTMGPAAKLVSLELEAPFSAAAPPGSWAGTPWTHALAGACGLLGSLARAPVRRVDAEAVRGDGRRLRTLAASFRFRSGLYAHLAIRRADRARVALWVSGDSGEQSHETFGDEEDARAAELRQILDALQASGGVPHGPLDAADTLRLTERVLRHIA